MKHFTLFKTLGLALISLLALWCYSCKDVVVPDVANQKIVVNTPLKNQVIRTESVTFWWSPMEGAVKYHFQLVQNRFDSLPLFKTDTTLAKTQFSIPLKVGVYQWKLWAENGLTHSDTIMQSFKVDSASIIEKIIKITTPALLESYSSLQGRPYRIQWQQITGARKYQLEINNDTTTFSPSNYYDLQFTSEQAYVIRVRAIGKDEKTAWSEYYKITWDITPTGAPTFTDPVNDFAVDFQIPFTIRFTSVAGASRYVVNYYKNTTASGFLTTDTVSTTVFQQTKGTYSRADTVIISVTALDLSNNQSTSVQRKLRPKQ